MQACSLEAAGPARIWRPRRRPTAACCADRGGALALARAAGTMAGSATAPPERTRAGPCQPHPAARRGALAATWSAARTPAPAVRRDPARGPGRCCGSRSAQQTTSEREQQGPLADPVTQFGPGLLRGRGRWRLSVVRRQTRVKFITARALPDRHPADARMGPRPPAPPPDACTGVREPIRLLPAVSQRRAMPAVLKTTTCGTRNHSATIRN